MLTAVEEFIEQKIKNKEYSNEFVLNLQDFSLNVGFIFSGLDIYIYITPLTFGNKNGLNSIYDKSFMR